MILIRVKFHMKKIAWKSKVKKKKKRQHVLLKVVIWDYVMLLNGLTTTWICIFYLCVCVWVRYFRGRCVCICVYVLYYEGGWGGILVTIHILFLKGAGVSDSQHFFVLFYFLFFYPTPSWERGFRGAVSRWLLQEVKVLEPRVRNTVAAPLQIINLAIMEWGVVSLGL